MSDSDQNSLNLSPDEKRAFSYLFAQADKDQLGVVTGENAVSFFERTSVSPNVLGEIWQLADTENRGLLTKQGFCIVLRLIGHYQAGREPTPELALRPGPIPKFDGLPIPGVVAAPPGGSAIPSPTTGAFPANVLQPQLSGQAPIRVPPLDPQKSQQYAGLFERSGAQNGLLDGGSAKAIFEKAGLPNEILGRIWMLSDREQKGALDQTEFVIAMHLLTSMKIRTMTALPSTLPPGLYEAAARRGLPPSRQTSGQAAIPRQLTGSNIGAIPRTQSPLARPAGYGTPPPQSAQATGTPWLITPADKAKFDQFFNNIDIQGRGVITGEQAVSFFSDSRLPEEALASIWDLSDINSEGQLNKDEFAVAMYLIRQQRAPNAPPLPAFLPPALVPPSMRKQAQQTQMSTAPAFDNANNTSNLPKSAADDLFGLDQPSPPQTQPRMPALQPQSTGASATRDPFAAGAPGSPGSPVRGKAQQPSGAMFQPLMAKSPFGPSPFSSTTLPQQNTGGSMGSSFGAARGLPQQQQSSAGDDLLGDSETSAAESSKITNETTELANMSSQIGNLRTQMEQTQSKKAASQADLTATTNQKRDLELRLQQFRTQYEQEVRAVKELEQQLVVSKESTKKLGQDLAMLEGTYQDLQTQHQKTSQALQADQQENATLKQRISQINAEVTKLKPEIEKLKMDARQQKGMVSINKKQLATNESERDRLQGEKSTLEGEAAEREEQARSVAAEPVLSPAAVPIPASNVVSPAASTLSSTNPFFRKPSNDGTLDRALSSGHGQQGSTSGPSPSAFDTLFGPSAAFASTSQAGSRTGTPPATSFGRSAPAAGMTESVQSISSVGEATPSATPPLSDQAKESPMVEPPPPPASGQFTAAHLPVVDLDGIPRDSDASSTMAIPPASRAGEIDTPKDARSIVGGSEAHHMPGSFTEDPTPTPSASDIPGAFPTDAWQSSTNGAEPDTPKPSTTEVPGAAKDDFDSAFAGFGDDDKAKETAKENEDPFAISSSQPASKASHSEFPPIQSLEHEDETDSEDEDDRGFDDNFTAASPPKNKAPVTSDRDAPALGSSSNVFTSAAGVMTAASHPPTSDAQNAPPGYGESNQSSHGGTGERTQENQFPSEFGGLLPAREDPTSPSAHEVASETTPVVATTTELAPESHQSSKAAPADDFDEFDDLEDAKPADKNGSDLEFGFNGNRSVAEFDEGFGSPARTMTSSHETSVPASRSLHQSTTNGFADFQPTASTSSAFDAGDSSVQQTPQNVQHDWDAIFSGLDSSKGVDTSLSQDPWGSATNGSASAAAQSAGVGPPPAIPTSKPERGGAITPGTEHDDPILKRLTGMGYPRKDALDALEQFDYDINKAVDHLTTN